MIHYLQAEGSGRPSLKLASLHRRCVGAGIEPKPMTLDAIGEDAAYVWITIERASAALPMKLPPGVSEAGPGSVVLARGVSSAEVANCVGGCEEQPAALATWASGYLPSWA